VSRSTARGDEAARRVAAGESIRDAARAVGLSEMSAYAALRRRGALPSRDLGRMTRAELARFLTPTALVDIVGPPGRGPTGPAARLTAQVVVEQDAGLLESPGTGPEWQLTAAGRAFVLSS